MESRESGDVQITYIRLIDDIQCIFMCNNYCDLHDKALPD